VSDFTEVKKDGRPPVTKTMQFAYGYQEFAMGFMTVLIIMFFQFFMTDVALIPAALAAAIMLAARSIDIFSVPAAGFIIQSTNFKNGNYSTWLFVATPLIVLFSLLMFSNFPLPVGVKASLMGAAYVISFFFANICSTARFSILPILTDDPHMRTVLSARRSQGGTAGNMVRGLVFVPLVLFLAGLTGSESTGYSLTALIFGMVAISGMYWLAFIAKPFEKIAKVKEGPKPTLKEMIIQLGTNKPLLLVVLAESLRMSAYQLLIVSNMYYFRYVLDNLLLLSVYMIITFGGGFLGNSLMGALSRKIGRKLSWISGMFIWIAGMTLAYFTSFGNAVLFIAWVTIAQLGMGLADAGAAAFFSDTADYGEVKQGKNIRAVNMGLVIFPIKMGVLLGGSIQAFSLAAIGFVADTTDQGVIRGIHTITTLAPILLGITAILFMAFYPLTEKRMTDIRDQLKAKYAR
jgi:sugar (glycoside-pentoside-hexuronide) transporter